MNCVVVTRSDYDGDVAPTTGPGTAAFQSNAPYPFTDWGSGVDQLTSRVVACGLRVRYIGTELNRGGQMIALADPSHSNMAGRTIVSLNGELETRKFPATREWVTVLYKPFFRDELDFVTGTPHAFILGVVIQAPDASTPVEYEFEMYAIHEYEGRKVRGKSPSHSDPVGFSAITSAALTSTALNPTTERTPQRSHNFFTDIFHSIENSATSAAHFIEHTGAAAINAGNAAVRFANTASKVARPLLALV